MGSNRVNSLCAVYADLVQSEVDKEHPDKEKIRELLDYIRENCQLIAFPKGETPPHLEAHLIQRGSRATGTTIYQGKKIPCSAAELARARRGTQQ